MLESLMRWGGPQDGFTVVRSQGAGPDAFTAELSARGPGEFNIAVSKTAADERLHLSTVVEIPAELLQWCARHPDAAESLKTAAAAVGDARAGLLSCALRRDALSTLVEIGMVIYRDLLNRHALNAAVQEIAKARRQMLGRFESMADSIRSAAEFQKQHAALEQKLRQEQAAFDKLLAELRSPEPHPQPQAGGPGQGQVPAARRCANPRCQQPLIAGDHFCRACGTPIAGAAR